MFLQFLIACSVVVCALSSQNPRQGSGGPPQGYNRQDDRYSNYGDQRNPYYPDGNLPPNPQYNPNYPPQPNQLTNQGQLGQGPPIGQTGPNNQQIQQYGRNQPPPSYNYQQRGQPSRDYPPEQEEGGSGIFSK